MMREGSFTASGPREPVRLAYAEWGERDNPEVLLCVHGLTRNSRDFDDVATALAGRYRVICLDVAGRGKSDRLNDKTLYANPVYAEHAMQLIAQLRAGQSGMGQSGVGQVDWIGTSMGGIIGMMVAARPDSPIRRMILNDVGAFIPKQALQRLAQYVGNRPSFATLDAAADHAAEILAGFGRLTRQQWLHLARHSYRAGADGTLELIYDPGAVAGVLAGPHKDIALWPFWMAIRCPVLLLRGAESDLLLEQTAVSMTRRGPATELIEFADCGHAPSLMTADQVGAIDNWLKKSSVH